jgi:hypothetical protein
MPAPYGFGPYGGGLYGGMAVTTGRVYGRLPEAYRNADEGIGYPLLRYLSLILDQLEPVDDLVDRIEYDADVDATSDLVDAATANAGWFPWLAQLVGVDLTGLDVDEQRAALVDPSTSWDHGTPGAIAEAAEAGLTGTQSVVVTPHHDGDPFLIGLGTLDSETVELDTYGELHAYAPTWADLHALGSYAGAAAPFPVIAAESERPAGYTLVRYSTGA